MEKKSAKVLPINGATTLRKLQKKINQKKGAFRKEKDTKRAEELSRSLAELEKKEKEMIASARLKKIDKSGMLQKFKDSTKPGSVFELPDGKKVIRSATFIATIRKNVFADPDVQTFYPSSEELQPHIDSGDYIVIMKNAENKNLPVAQPVLFKDIQKARRQRFGMIGNTNINQAGQDVLQSAMIRKAIKTEEGLKPKEIIEKYKDQFFESRDSVTIGKDLIFLCKIF